MQTSEIVEQMLAQIETQAHHSGLANGYQDLLKMPELPMDALAEVGALTRLGEGGADALPSLLMDNRTGQAQIELCPFGPLALISSDGEMDTDPIAQALVDAGITPLFPSDLDQAGKWHGTPLGQWLFPRRLGDALALFDGLRSMSPKSESRLT